MDFFVELFAEFFGTLYINFALVLVPDKKLKKWQMYLLYAISIFVSIFIFASICFGVAYLIVAEEKSTFYLGLGLTIAGVVLLSIQIILYIITKKKEKALNKQKAMERKLKKMQEKLDNSSHEIIVEQVENKRENK